MINFDEISKRDKRKFIREEVLTTPEAIEVLGVSRARLSHLIKKGKINPVKKLGCVSLFLKDDVIAKREELELLRVKYRPYEN
ncbi:DNA-binding protein [Bacillus anthracis]|uniref:helix-turn-helix domain-containing protein n=1 Tax=Bacillus TaxID=1386 RepID=UPI000CD9BD9F|nr:MULTISPECIES: helix-turn-helix domain-containing protein [Bacillus]MED3536228.1 helix-turn-helix domain-containing protein [Bacillus toyonensis]MEE2018271.1 helix-turn-helix domain-containing protein [Bacillus toyonensis]QBJ67103.1 DNA-binding protein [Bacillus anthracis]THG62630.1 helix-turn-helix domain-containing protein [Bacillus sp. HUB-I-004]